MSKRPLHAKILNFFGEVYKSFRFSYHHLKERNTFGNYNFPYESLHKGETVYILANGPSLNEEIAVLLKNSPDLSNSLVVNFFAESDLFLQIKPRFYCLADPMFNVKEMMTEREGELFRSLNQSVNWSMTLFVWKKAEANIAKFITNPNITIKGLSILTFEGFESNRYKYYKRGVAVPSYVNVTIMALYALLNLGYSTIYLYGVDHSFLAGLGVNDDNRLCIVDKHFYGTEKYEFGPKIDGTLWTMKDFVYDKYLTFVEHEVMRGYADYLGAKIINCTKDSWIDAYVRKAQLESNQNKNISNI